MKKFTTLLLLFFTVLYLTSCKKNNEPDTPAVTDSQGREISAKDPFVRKTIQVGETAQEFMSYIDEGNGDPVLLLHGAPSSNYLWRNVVPHLSDNARVIAPDWMGSGNSGVAPNNDYSYLKQLAYLESFIEKLNLNNITLVLHRAYASKYEQKHHLTKYNFEKRL